MTLSIIIRDSFAERIYLPRGYKSLFSTVPPQIATVEEEITYGISEYSVHVKIPEVAPNFFDDLLNFSTPDSALHIQNLSYNINYSFKIVAVNCFGVENTTQLEIMQGTTNSYSTYKHIYSPSSAGCDVPSCPLNGSTKAYKSTEEGAVIQFQCPNDEKWTGSQCVHTSWLPDPMDINCSLPLKKDNILRPSRFFFLIYLYILLIEPYVHIRCKCCYSN